jgi:hypothetical protein
MIQNRFHGNVSANPARTTGATPPRRSAGTTNELSGSFSRPDFYPARRRWRSPHEIEEEVRTGVVPPDPPKPDAEKRRSTRNGKKNAKRRAEPGAPGIAFAKIRTARDNSRQVLRRPGEKSNG